PLNMKDGVSIQGTNALNTVIDCQLSPVGLRFAIQIPPSDDFEGTYFDGFMITNAGKAITLDSNTVGFKPTFSNLFIVDNSVGIFMRAALLTGGMTSPDDTDQNNFVEHRPRLANLTIADNDIGISDEARSGSTILWGEADPAIANCLFDNMLDLNGTDLNDLVAGDDGLKLSNVFDSYESSATRIKQGRKSPASGSLPFVESSTIDVFVNRSALDYRLNPSSLSSAVVYLVDQGLGFDSALGFHNGMTQIEPFGGRGEMIWDMDCEGYGNVRMVGGGHDIGADELAELVIAGYLRGTTTFVQFTQADVWVTPTDGQPASQYPVIRLLNQRLSLDAPYLSQMPMEVAGARQPGTTLPVNFPGIGSQSYLEFGGLYYLLLPQPAVSGVSASLFIFVLPYALPETGTISNHQYMYFDGAGASYLTNLQSFTIIE
ncbi:MAG: hypothetical protein P8J33_16230, partial [Pirellulaceae bacterium]|nr:hypothetical protein [Pirellulaceae bacterium]